MVLGLRGLGVGAYRGFALQKGFRGCLEGMGLGVGGVRV